MDTNKLMVVLTLPTTFGGCVNVPVSQIESVCTYNERTTLTLSDNKQVVTLSTDTSHVRDMWVSLLEQLSKMGIGFSQRDYDILPLMSEASGKTLLTTALETNLVAHEYAHHEMLQQWANEERLTLLGLLKERRSADVQ
jgi:hypothetical protein